MNKIICKQKENPISENVSPKSLANDFNEQKIGKMRQSFRGSLPSAFENDTPFNGQLFTAFRDLTEKDIILIIIFSKPKTSDPDPRPTSPIKTCLDELAYIITRIAKLFLCTGTFPN